MSLRIRQPHEGLPPPLFLYGTPPPFLLAYGVDNPRLSLSASQGRPEIMRLFTVLKNDNNLFAILTPHCHSLFELCVITTECVHGFIQCITVSASARPHADVRRSERLQNSPEDASAPRQSERRPTRSLCAPPTGPVALGRVAVNNEAPLTLALFGCGTLAYFL